MNSSIQDYVTHTSITEWKPLKESGVITDGIFLKILRYDKQKNRPPSIILKFEPGASYPYHNHPAGEELFVLKGECMVNEAFLQEGDYLYTPAGFKHAVKSSTGCEILFIIPEEVVIIESEGNF